MSYFQKIKKFFNQNRFECIALLFIVVLALGLRLYRIEGYMTFLGDEGRDVRVVRNILHGDPAFIGPQTSIGGMYLGPLYYYMMAPALLLSGLNPVGPAIMVALLSVITIVLTWYFGRRWFNPLTGILAAFLFTISPVSIIYSHSSWNPNPIPFFALLSVWGIYQVWTNQKYRLLPLVGLAVAFALQMHYLALLLLPVLGIFWFISLKQSWSKKKLRKIFLLQSLWAVLIFLFLMSPLLLFDLKHNGMNFNAFKTFFTNRQTTINFNPVNSNRFLPVLYKIVSDLFLGQAEFLVPLFSFLTVTLSLWALLVTKKKKPAILLLVWLGTALLGLALYKQHVYAHYFGFIYPAVYLLSGWVISSLLSDSFSHKLLGLLLFTVFTVLSIRHSPLQYQPNHQLQRTEEVVDSIIESSDGESFNFGLIAKQNYDESYRYFFENKQASLVRGEDGITDQLFVVCENEECQPEGDPAWQVAIFGPADTVDQWDIDYIQVFKLVHAD